MLLLLVGLSACSGNDADKENQKTGKVEQLPKVDKSRFREFKGEGFSIQLLKEMSWKEVAGMNLLSAEYLPKEYHLAIESYPFHYVKHDSSFPKDSEKQLQWFAKTAGLELKGKLVNPVVENLTESMVSKRKCFKQKIHGKEYGFPLRKTYFLRYYQTKDSFIKISAWTISDNAKDYEKLAQYMGMTLSIN